MPSSWEHLVKFLVDLNGFKARAELGHKTWIESLLNLDPEFNEANESQTTVFSGLQTGH